MSEEKSPLISGDLIGLSKPASKLIDAVRSGTGQLFEPQRIRRKAKAEADSLIILAHAKAEEKDIILRASERLAYQEIRRQKNIEAITKGGIEHLPDTVNDEKVDEDWMAYFLDFCQDVSNEQMRTLWAKILSGETAAPGSFSLRTLSAVRLITKGHAEIFTKFSAFAWEMDGQMFHFESPRTKELRDRAGVNTEKRLLLDHIGLLNTDPQLGFVFKPNSEYMLGYHNKLYILKPKHPAPVKTSINLFTDIGNELYPISGARQNVEYERSMVEYWKSHSIDVSLRGESMS